MQEEKELLSAMDGQTGNLVMFVMANLNTPHP